MSSVATRRCWKESRIACCSASLREKTTTSAGTPISPSSRRRTSACPSEPVPPVTMTLLPSSNVPRFVAPGRGAVERGHHLGPGGGRPAGRGAEARGVERPIDLDAVVGHDVEIELVGVAEQDQQVVLADRLGAEM